MTVRIVLVMEEKFIYQTVPVTFEKIRRVTDNLIGTTTRWGDAKKSELKDRVYHK